MKRKCVNFNDAQTETSPMAPGGAALGDGDLNPSFLLLPRLVHLVLLYRVFWSPEKAQWGFSFLAFISHWFNALILESMYFILFILFYLQMVKK